MIVVKGGCNLLKKMGEESTHLFSEYVLKIILLSLFPQAINKPVNITYVQSMSCSQKSIYSLNNVSVITHVVN